MTDCDLIQRWQDVNDKVKQASQEAQREGSVTLLAVSKTKPAQQIATLAKAGQVHFGENYLQEAKDKISRVTELLREERSENPVNDDTQSEESHDKSNSVEALPLEVEPSLVWHYIGHIQRNKTRDIAENFDWVHTLERDIIAKRLNEQRPENLDKLQVLIQVNIDNEESKSGCLPNELDSLIQSVLSYDRLQLRGLMIIPSKESTDAFMRTRLLFDRITTDYPELSSWDTLSMGMSADMDEAIKHGSTMVRVGSAIFGSRE